DTITVRLVNQPPAPVSISRIWAFTNFDEYFQSAHLAVPFHLAPTVSLNWHNADTDLANLRKIAQSLGNHPNAKPAWTTWIPYASANDEEINRRIDYLLKLAQSAAMPVQIC